MMDGKISNLCQIASLRRYELSDGPERGLRVLDCDNGKLRFLLNESCALDVMQLFDGGMNISFVSKNGFTMRETDFATRFEGGMLYTVGLDSAGAREGFPLHGTLHNIPARVTTAVCDENGILVEAEIEDTELFGKHLRLKRRVCSAVNSDTLTIEDTLENLGTRDEEYCLLYHVNVGYPMLDEGAELLDDAEEIIPRTPWAAEHLESRAKMGAPVPNEEERCYFLRLQTPRVTLKNEKLRKAFTLEWTGETLPYFVEWKSMAAGDYALGLEPSTTELDGRFSYRTLKAGEKIRFNLVMRIKNDKEQTR